MPILAAMNFRPTLTMQLESISTQKILCLISPITWMQNHEIVLISLIGVVLLQTSLKEVMEFPVCSKIVSIKVVPCLSHLINQPNVKISPAMAGHVSAKLQHRWEIWAEWNCGNVNNVRLNLIIWEILYR